MKRGILTAWRTRTSAQPDGAELDALTADAVRLAREQRLLAGAVSGTA